MSKLIGITAKYIGTPVFSYEMPKYKDIIVSCIYEENNKDTYAIKEKGWVYERIVLTSNSFVFTIKHKSFYCELIVPTINNPSIDIHAIYLGPPVMVGKKYDTNKLYVDLKLKDGTIKSLKLGEYTVSDFEVYHNKNNIYEIEYGNLKDKFSVYGYSINNTIDIELQIFIIHENHFEEDITEIFGDLFYDERMEKIYVTLERMNRILFDSNYRILLPKDSGLMHKYASEWLISKKDTNINATLNKVFNEEDYHG